MTPCQDSLNIAPRIYHKECCCETKCCEEATAPARERLKEAVERWEAYRAELDSTYFAVREGKKKASEEVKISKSLQEESKTALDEKERVVSLHSRCPFVREEQSDSFQVLGPEGPYWPS